MYFFRKLFISPWSEKNFRLYAMLYSVLFLISFVVSSSSTGRGDCYGALSVLLLCASLFARMPMPFSICFAVLMCFCVGCLCTDFTFVQLFIYCLYLYYCCVPHILFWSFLSFRRHNVWCVAFFWIWLVASGCRQCVFCC